VRQLTFNKVDNGTEYIDLGECLSLVNRKLFRQGYVYVIESLSWQHAAGLEVQLRSLPTSWTVYNSWKKAYRLWNKMNREAAQGLGRNAYPAYHDFKVFYNSDHYVTYAGVASNLLPVDGNRNLFSNVGREWVYAQYVESTQGGAVAASEHATHMLGSNSAVANGLLSTEGSNAIIQMYGDTRITVGEQEPDLPGDASTSWATTLLDTGEVSQDIVNHLEGHNDAPPYARALDAEGGDNPIYVGGSESGVSGHRLATMEPIGGETIYAPGGEAPLGLLQVTGGGDGDSGILTINLALGPYNGVMATPMGKVPT